MIVDGRLLLSSSIWRNRDGTRGLRRPGAYRRQAESQVFIDVDTIEPDVDFAEEVFRAVAACKVLLAIIGPTWLIATDERGRRRLDDPDDIIFRGRETTG